MSKIKKLIKNPKQFFKDSLYFKTNNIKIDKKFENLFIISHLGQLNQVEKLIEYEGLVNNLLVILYTNKNLKVPKSIQSSINKKIFQRSILFQLPINPNDYKIKKLLHMKRNYEVLLKNTQPKNIFLLSFENHYSLLAELAYQKKIKLNLIDEGTATYKTKDQSEYYTKVSFFKKIIAKSLKINEAFDWWIKFDNVYGAFPELLKKTFIAENYYKFFAYAGNLKTSQKTLDLIKKYNITSNDIIYVNQRYAIDNEEFTNAILNILDTISEYYNCKIFIKMHPKDNQSLIDLFKNKLELYTNIVFIEDNEFLIEETMETVKPKGVVGLTSTSLIYTSLVSSKTKSYSIAPWFLSLVSKGQIGYSIIEDHFSILEKFYTVNVLSSKNDLNLVGNIKSESINNIEKNGSIQKSVGKPKQATISININTKEKQ